MKLVQKEWDLPQLVFSLIFIIIMVVACFWITEPFIPSFAWASMVVIATWPVMLRVQRCLWGHRGMAVVVMTLLLLLIFIIPVVLLVNSVIEYSEPVLAWATAGHLTFPDLQWLNSIPFAGKKLYSGYHSLIAGGGSALLAKAQPYIGRTATFFVTQAGHFGRFIVHLVLMLFFSVLLYWRGEQVGQAIRHFAFRMASHRGDATVLLAAQAIRAVALGIVVTALAQGVLSGIGLAVSGIPYATLLTGLIILLCLIQLGPLLVLIPAIIWLYWSGDTIWATVLLVWSGVVASLDNILRPVLIRMGAELPVILVITGVIGGLIAFGMIGLFIGPVVLPLAYRLIYVWTRQVPAPDEAVTALAEKD